ncbi:MAG: FAD-dependent oxidoreductase [Actinomycetota bacterium]
MSETYRVIIIGAGLAGLTAATTIRAAADGLGQPVEVLIVDKGRSVGGRLATRRLGDATIDHGAQFFTVRSDAFALAVDGWLADGVVEEWCRGFGPEDGYPRYRTAAGMNQLAKHLAANLSADPAVTIAPRQRAAAIIPGPEAWAVTYDGYTREPDEAEAAIATPPVPQTMELLRAGAVPVDAELAGRLDAMAYHKVIGVLATLDRSPELPEPGALQRPDHEVFTFVADNAAKGISANPALTCHLAHDLSAALWDASDEDVLAAVAEELEAVTGPASTIEIQVKRWRYAGPVTPWPDPVVTVTATPGPLVIGGDGFGGSKVEGAYLSGLAAAEEILGSIRP